MWCGVVWYGILRVNALLFERVKTSTIDPLRTHCSFLLKFALVYKE